MDAKTFILIEKYLNDELSDDFLLSFKAEMKSNPALRKEIQLHKEINEALLEKDTIKLRNELQSIHHEYARKRLAAKVISLFTQSSYVSGIAAAILITLVIGGILLFSSGQSASSDGIFSNYYKADDAIMMVRSGTSPEDIDLKEALMAYHEKKYDNAIELLQNQNNNVLAKYYLGLSYLETDKLEDAIGTFQAIIDHKKNLFVEQAEWYLSLCYVKSSQEEKAKVLLNKISNSQSIYKEKAEKILKKI
ncbi:MAG: tetratricopeptide repeat protein [Bacteroidota bacterium]|nr:tetratricopeptide repeat protein [Bacteroidota bacterium]